MRRDRTIDRLIEASSIGEGLREMDADPERHLSKLSEELKPPWRRKEPE